MRTDKAKLKGVLLPNERKQHLMFKELTDWMMRHDEFIKEATAAILASALAYHIALRSTSNEEMENGILMVLDKFADMTREHRRNIEQRAARRKN